MTRTLKRSLPLLAIGTVAFAANADPASGGFKGPDNLELLTVAEAVELPEDSRLKLVGYITRAMGDETYEFKDDTGTMVVEIDDDEWNGLEVAPEDKLEISGEIDREWRETGMEVDSIQLVR